MLGRRREVDRRVGRKGRCRVEGVGGGGEGKRGWTVEGVDGEQGKGEGIMEGRVVMARKREKGTG